MDSWLQEYEELMFGKNHTRSTMDAAAELKYKHMPDVLYKYRQVSDNSLNALENDFLVFSEPSLFNDPFEAPIKILADKAKENISKKILDSFKKEKPDLSDEIWDYCWLFLSLSENTLSAEACGISIGTELFDILKPVYMRAMDVGIEKHYQQARNMYNICCLSASGDIAPMWAHYADNHKGFCIGYGIKELGINFTLTQLTLPVLYRENMNINVEDIDDIDGSLGMHALSIKSPAWSYEREWRIFALHNAPKTKEIMPKPKEILLGAKMVPHERQRVIEICQRKNIPFKQMVIDDREHKMYAIDV